uniref:LongchainfattyacidCoA ligase putative n=1 Tax=Albugo laibachii Nc14 TaxID=890382 RepID=F0W1J3_9STRA|nr:longchainfattyacidCoA ligase putative [Albugo laibachii Nc14]|eukprot:CCA14922.1 longchainfattyacidCoA ligase putative [Albugo laibachii Nc14]
MHMASYYKQKKSHRQLRESRSFTEKNPVGIAVKETNLVDAMAVIHASNKQSDSTLPYTSLRDGCVVKRPRFSFSSRKNKQRKSRSTVFRNTLKFKNSFSSISNSRDSLRHSRSFDSLQSRRHRDSTSSTTRQAVNDYSRAGDEQSQNNLNLPETHKNAEAHSRPEHLEKSIQAAVRGSTDSLRCEPRRMFSKSNSHLFDARNSLAGNSLHGRMDSQDVSIWKAFEWTSRHLSDSIAVTGREFSSSIHSVDKSSKTYEAKNYTWMQYKEQVEMLSNGLLRLGFRAGEGAIFSAQSSMQMICLNMAVIAVGGIVSHIHTTWTAEEICDAIVPCANATIFILDELNENFISAIQALTMPRKTSEHPNINLEVEGAQPNTPVSLKNPFRAVILLRDKFPAEELVMLNISTHIFHYPEFCEFACRNLQSDAAYTHGDEDLFSFPARISRVTSDQCCVMSFGYDPEGEIRGSCLSHDNILFTAMVLAKCFGPLSVSDRLISYLALHHVAAQVLELYLPIASGMSVVCAPSFREYMLVDIITKYKPTIFFANPETWAHISTQVYKAKGEANSFLYRWAKQRATNNSNKLRFGKYGMSRRRSLGYLVAKTLVLDNIKKKIGLQSCHTCYSVLAPLDLDLEGLFKTIDVPIYQLHGSPETTGFGAINYPHAWVFGSSGRALDGTRLYDSEVTHEVHYKGRNVFMGYVRPMVSSRVRRTSITTRKTIESACVPRHDCQQKQAVKIQPQTNPEGWYRSAHCGHLTPEGFLMITDTPRDFLILSTGDWVPTKPFERALLQQPELDRVVLVGDNRPFLSVLLFVKLRQNKSGGRSKGMRHRTGHVSANQSIVSTPPRAGSSGSTGSASFTSQGAGSIGGLSGHHASRVATPSKTAAAYIGQSSSSFRRELSEDVIRFGQQIGSQARTIGDLMKCSAWAIHFDQVLQGLPQKCSLSHFRLRKWILMAEPFTVASGELHPVTGQVRRRFVNEKYRPLFDTIYG